MTVRGNIEAQWMWLMLFPETDRGVNEPAVDYGDLLDGMEAAELMALMLKVQERLKNFGCGAGPITESVDPIELFIGKNYTIRMGVPDGPMLQLRPLVKTLFILFLKHPEGILLKQRDIYRAEMEKIYSTINPNTDREDVKARIGRLVDIEDNSFSEKASVLNARLGELLPEGIAGDYQIQGYNGCPRKIRLNPLLVHWE